MTVAATIPTIRYPYAGVGSYIFTYRVFKDTDLTISFTDDAGVVSILSLATDYTVTLVAGVDGGVVVITAALGTGTLEIRRVLPYTQETDWVNNDAFDMAILEDSQDRGVMLMQQLEVLVTEGALSPNWQGVWVPQVLYRNGDYVKAYNGNWYITRIQHTSNDFIADLASGLWQIMLDVSVIEGYANSASASASASEVSNIASGASASASAVSASDALASKTAAGLSEANSAVNAQNSGNCAQSAFDDAERAVAAADVIPDPTAGAPGDVAIVNPTNDGWVYAPLGGGGLSWQATKFADFTAIDGEGYPFDTSAASYTLTLPLAPTLNTQIAYKDFAQTFQTFPLLFNLNGELFEGLSSYTAESKGEAGTLVFIGGTQGWVKVADSKPLEANQHVTGVYATGGIDGGGIESHTNTTVTMRPYSCIADDQITKLYKPTTTVVDLGTPAINTDYHLFMVKLTDGTFSYMSDTDIDGAGLTGILAKRWDAYVPVDSAGAIQLLWMHGDEIFFSNQASMYVTTSLTTSFVEYSLSAILPIARIDSVALKSLTITASWAIAFDASNRQLDFAAPSAGQVTREAYLPIANSVWLRASSSASITVSSIKLKR